MLKKILKPSGLWHLVYWYLPTFRMALGAWRSKQEDLPKSRWIFTNLHCAIFNKTKSSLVFLINVTDLRSEELWKQRVTLGRYGPLLYIYEDEENDRKTCFPLYFNCSICVINAKSIQFSLQIRCKAFICASKEVRDVLTHAAREKGGYGGVGQCDKSRTLHAGALT